MAPPAGPARPPAARSPAGNAQPEQGHSTHRSASSGTGRRRCPRSDCKAKPPEHCWRASHGPEPAFSTRHGSGTDTLPASQAHRRASLTHRASLSDIPGRAWVLYTHPDHVCASSTSSRLRAGKPPRSSAGPHLLGRGVAQAARSPHTNVQSMQSQSVSLRAASSPGPPQRPCSLGSGLPALAAPNPPSSPWASLPG